MSSDKEQEYFSDGISEELLNLLAKIPQLQVTARTSSFAFKGKEIGDPGDRAHAARGARARRLGAQGGQLGTDHGAVDQGRHRHAPVVADLRSQARRHLRDPGRDRGRRGEAAQGHAAWRGAEGTHDRSRGLRALSAGRPARTAGHCRGVPAVRRALPQGAGDRSALRPGVGRAGRATSTNEANQGLLSNKEGYAQAREAATKALAIDSEYALAHARLGCDRDVRRQRPRRRGATLQARAGARSGGPGRAAQQRHAAPVSRPPGRGAGARGGPRPPRSGERDGALQPGRQPAHGRPARRGDRVVPHRAEPRPGRGRRAHNIGVALLLKGDAQGALAEIEQETSEMWKMIGLPMAYHALGRKADSDTALAALIAKYEKDSPYNIAYVYAFRGEADQAFAWLDKAVEYGDHGLCEIVTENLFDKIHDDPRWLPFLRKVGKAPEQLAKIEFKVTLPQ